MTVKIIRLMNGEEIIGKTDDGIMAVTVSKPAAIIVQPDPNSGRATMGLVEYLPMGKTKDILINKSHIMFMYDPMDDVENAYNKMFGSGLISVKQPSIMSLTK